MQTLNLHLTRAIKYAIVGAANTLLYTALLYFFLEKMAWGSVASVTSAYLLAVIFQYTANKYFTFQANGNAPRQFVRYLLSVLASYLLSLAIVEGCINYVKVSTGITVIICMVATASLGYLLGHFWVYK
ncbi:MAG TPA: GtrA family protein [Burkholderiales bacterium]|nr:GtrA family protein [Burkholderiales bacterium]